MKLQFSQQLFEKYLNIAFHKNMSGEIWFVVGGRMDRQTDGHHEFKSNFSQSSKWAWEVIEEKKWVEVAVKCISN